LSAILFSGDLTGIGTAGAAQNTDDKTVQFSEKLSFSKDVTTSAWAAR